MKLNPDQLEKLALHSAFGLHLVAKWMAPRTDVPTDIRDRLATNLEAIDGILVKNGHDWIAPEIEATESALHS